VTASVLTSRPHSRQGLRAIVALEMNWGCEKSVAVSGTWPAGKPRPSSSAREWVEAALAPPHEEVLLSAESLSSSGFPPG
jgi:hypothetical protein